MCIFQSGVSQSVNSEAAVGNENKMINKKAFLNSLNGIIVKRMYLSDPSIHQGLMEEDKQPNIWHIKLKYGQQSSLNVSAFSLRLSLVWPCFGNIF